MCGGGEGVGVRGRMRENEGRMLNKGECGYGVGMGVFGVCMGMQHRMWKVTVVTPQHIIVFFKGNSFENLLPLYANITLKLWAAS